MQKILLKNVTHAEAQKIIFEQLEKIGFFKKWPHEKIETTNSCSRTTSRQVIAQQSSPPENISAMDGIATMAEKTFSATYSNPIILELNKDFRYINTGEATGEFDCVIKIEEIEKIDETKVRIFKSYKPYENIRFAGEDIVQGEVIMPKHHLIRPEDVSLLVSAGVEKIFVKKRPHICIIPTGSELVEPFEHKQSGKIYESNSFMLKYWLENSGAVVERNQIVEDKREDIIQVLEEKAGKFDILILTGGTSHGEYDFTAEAIRRLGELFIHGVSVRPGKPFVFGIVKGTPVFGLPGYPQAAYFDFMEFVMPVINRITGVIHRQSVIDAKLANNIDSPLGVTHFIPVSVCKVKEDFIAHKLKGGAGILSSITKQDGYFIIPPRVEGIKERETVRVALNKDIKQIENKVMMVGSHDFLIDLIADYLADLDIPFSSINVGSFAGIIAIAGGKCHLAGTHIFEPETGEFNISYVKKYVKRSCVLVNLCYREQGLMVQKGNHKNIKGIRDLARPDVRIINRQKGSGTRILFDNLLKKEAISPDKIQGYNKEEFTHTNVAYLVKTGIMDAGLGINYAARLFELDFVPVFIERYDLLVLREFFEDERFEAIMRIIKSKDFLMEAEKFGGYSFKDTGKIFLEI